MLQIFGPRCAKRNQIVTRQDRFAVGANMKRFKSVDEFLAGTEQWQEELALLRKILLSCDVEETVKWGAPAYTYRGKNVVGIGAFKSYVGLWFHQGALLTDEAGVLINAQEGVTRAMRQWRFASKKEIKTRLIKQYVKEAIGLVEAGKQIKPVRKKKTVVIPSELKVALGKNKKAKANFAAMTPGCRREYADYIAAAKRDETKERRLKKILPMILAAKGLNDKYRS